MFQIRIHGRGGQGVVTAAELLSVAGGDIVKAERTVTNAIGNGRRAAYAECPAGAIEMVPEQTGGAR